MKIFTQYDLAKYEKVSPPIVETSSFKYAFAILPHFERIAINCIYAFCSYIDSIVDTNPSFDQKIIKEKDERLKFWEYEIEKIFQDNINNKFHQLAEIIQRFDIPKQYFLTLINGCRQDLIKTRYKTIDDLKIYCYGVASVVGLISIEIFGYKYEETKNYAVNLGYALQLTNILRDIKPDKDRGYIYLPEEDLKKFQYTEEDLQQEIYNENFIELMRYETHRAREFYHKARTSLRPDERASIVAAEIMDTIYYRLLEKIELNNFQVFLQRIRVSNIHKMMSVFKHWLDIRIFIERLKK